MSQLMYHTVSYSILKFLTFFLMRKTLEIFEVLSHKMIKVCYYKDS